MDEPTSNLDKESVEIFKNMIRELKKERIVIIVSHDNYLVDCCDYVYRMEDGNLVSA